MQKEKKSYGEIAKSLNSQQNLKEFQASYVMSVILTIQKVCGHEQFQGYFWCDGEFRYLCGAVGIADLVGEVHADLG